MAETTKVVVELTGTDEFRAMEAEVRELRAEQASHRDQVVYLRSRCLQARTERDTARGIAMRLEEELAQTREALTTVADGLGDIGFNLRAGAIALHTFLASEE